MICAAVALANIKELDDNDRDEYEDADLHESGAGWLIFLAVMCMGIEPIIILVRFLNFSFVNQNFLIFAVIVSVKDVAYKYNVLYVNTCTVYCDVYCLYKILEICITCR